MKLWIFRALFARLCPSVRTITHRVGERCQLWKYQRCGLFHESPDLYDIVEAVNDLTDAVEHMDKTIDRLQL